MINKISIYDNLQICKNIANSDIDLHEVIKKVGLEKINLKKKASDLSGGQKQRVAIARSLIMDRSIIVGDEPTGNLDTKNSILICEILKELSKEKLIIIVTHNKELFEKYADRLLTLSDGNIIGDEIIEEKDDHKEISSSQKLKLSFKETFMLYRSTKTTNIKKYFNIVFIIVMMMCVFLGLNVTFNNKSKSFMENVNKYKLPIVDYDVLIDKNDDNEITYHRLPLDSVDYIARNFTNYALCHTTQFEGEYYVDSEKKYGPFSINKTYVCDFVNSNLLVGKNELIDNDCILSFNLAGQIATFMSFDNYETLIGKKLYINENIINVVGIEQKINDNFPNSDIREAYNQSSNYIYINQEMYYDIYHVYSLKELSSIQKFICDGNIGGNVHNQRGYSPSSYSGSLLLGEYPMNNSEVCINTQMANALAGDNISSLIGSKVTIDFDLLTNEIVYSSEYVISGILDDSSLNYVFSNEELILIRKKCLDYSDDRKISIFSKDLSVSKVKMLKKNGFAHNTCISDYHNIGLGRVEMIGYIILIMVIPLLLVLMLYQISYSSETIFSQKKLIGLLKSFSLSNREISKIFIVEYIYINIISLVASFLITPVSIVLLNFAITEDISSIIVVYNPLFLIIMFLVTGLISFIGTKLSLRRLDKKNDVDLVYER